MQIAAPRRAAPLSSIAGGRKALMLAAVLGLLAALLSWNYLKGAGQGARQSNLVPVVVAARDIPVRTQVTPELLTVKQVPADARHEKAFTALEQLNGKVTNLPIAAGEQVLDSKFFARKEDSGLAYRIPAGKRAISVNVNELISSGGLIVPGDFVDVMTLFPPLGTEGESVSVVLQNVEVLAVAQSLQTAAEAQSGGIAGMGGTRSDGRQEAVARPNARTPRWPYPRMRPSA
jgi:pilus assembly protein CpaB